MGGSAVRDRTNLQTAIPHNATKIVQLTATHLKFPAEYNPMLVSTGAEATSIPPAVTEFADFAKVPFWLSSATHSTGTMKRCPILGRVSMNLG
jgi:hypothetical protein